MTMLSPGAAHYAELREQLGSVGRALTVQRALVWLARGLAAGALVVLGLVTWAWARDTTASLPLVGLVAIAIGAALLAATGSLFVRHATPNLARRVDRAAHLQERSTTALELGGRGDEFPLAVAQMRDAVENLRRVDLLETFPLRVPKNELMIAFFTLVVAALVSISPNPWLLRARASNPAVTIAREQAQRVQRLADTIQPHESPELEALRALVSKGARTIDVRSNEPDAALNALQDLEEQVRQMSAGDDQLTAALAAIASALASDPATQQFANAINTGDLRQISQAAKDLASSTSSLSGQDQQRVARVLRDASNRAGRVSQSVAGQLSDAAEALQAGAGGQMSDGRAGGASAPNGRSASDALNQLSASAAAGGERQRAASQLESSRNALERALGRTQSRSGSSGGRSSSSSHRQQAAGSSLAGGEQAQGAGQGQPGDQGEGSDPGSGGTPGGGQGAGGESGMGGGFSTGGQSLNRTGPSSQLDTITTPHQVPGSGTIVPDESSTNPYLGEAATGAAYASDENVQPTFTRKPTQGSDAGRIPLGLRDLVKDYFSSLDQR